MRTLPCALMGLALVGCALPVSGPGRPPDLRFDGYGAARFGAAEVEVRRAYGGPLASDFLPEEPARCYLLWPPKDSPLDGIAFMFEGGKFVRYDGYGSRLSAPGGLRVGMPATAVEAAFRGRFTRHDAPRVPDGSVLVVDPGPGFASRLVLEVDAAGIITGWRIGREPQVHYVEGCL